MSHFKRGWTYQRKDDIHKLPAVKHRAWSINWNIDIWNNQEFQRKI